VMDPKTGLVYAVVNQEWALRRNWNPASTIKLLTGLAGINEKVISYEERIRVPDRSEPIDLNSALTISNNSYFTLLGERVGAEQLINYARLFGLGDTTGINYEGELAGRLPRYRSNLKAGRLGGYGEGVEVTLIQLATLVAAIANDGNVILPRVPSSPLEPRLQAQVRRRLDIPLETLSHIKQGMVAAVKEGTGRNAFDPEFTVAGKTGTISNGESSVGLFTSYAPAENPRLVIAVVTRGKDESGAGAAKIAGKIYQFLKRHR
jgi:penicillin-binding protein 2